MKETLRDQVSERAAYLVVLAKVETLRILGDQDGASKIMEWYLE